MTQRENRSPRFAGRCGLFSVPSDMCHRLPLQPTGILRLVTLTLNRIRHSILQLTHKGSPYPLAGTKTAEHFGHFISVNDTRWVRLSLTSSCLFQSAIQVLGDLSLLMDVAAKTPRAISKSPDA